MTTDQKKTAGMVVGGVSLAGLLALLASWPQIQPVADWAMANLGVILGREQVQAVLAAWAAGVAAGGWLPHVLPSHWTPAHTRVVSGAICAVVATGIAAVLVPTRIGAVYAVMAGIACPTVAQLIAGVQYWLFPTTKPESLQP